MPRTATRLRNRPSSDQGAEGGASAAAGQALHGVGALAQVVGIPLDRRAPAGDRPPCCQPAQDAMRCVRREEEAEPNDHQTEGQSPSRPEHAAGCSPSPPHRAGARAGGQPSRKQLVHEGSGGRPAPCFAWPTSPPVNAPDGDGTAPDNARGDGGSKLPQHRGLDGLSPRQGSVGQPLQPQHIPGVPEKHTEDQKGQDAGQPGTVMAPSIASHPPCSASARRTIQATTARPMPRGSNALSGPSGGRVECRSISPDLGAFRAIPAHVHAGAVGEEDGGSEPVIAVRVPEGAE